VFQIPKVSRPPRLIDFVKGITRESEIKITTFRQREPGDGSPASQSTAAYLSYDDKNLYVVFVCKDEPGKVRAHLTRRDEADGDDQVSLYLDTFGDRRRAYYFGANPLGVQTDGIFLDEAANSSQDNGEEDSAQDTNLDLSFDALWYSAGQITRDGYVVWMAVPFKSLRFAKRESQTWRIALGRTFARSNEEVFAPYITERVEGMTGQFARLDGLQTISPGRNIQLIPYGFLSNNRTLNDEDLARPLYLNRTQGRGGGDAKIVLRDAWTVDLTGNPDFSQVETDDPQLTVDQRFEVFFPEKRPFFLENSDLFKTPINLFYSRRIENPQFGARLTGKSGPWSLGLLTIDDREPGFINFETGLPRSLSDPLHGLRAAIGVGRLQREFGDQSSVGILVTSEDFAAQSNRVYSADTHLRLNSNWSLTGQFVNSQTRNQDGSRESGFAGVAELFRSGRNLTYLTSYDDRTPNFNGNQLGFIQRTDIRQVTNYASYLWRPEGKHILSFGPLMTVLGNWDHTGKIQDLYSQVGFTASFTNSTQLQVAHNQAYELFDGIGFHKGSNAITFSSQPLRWLGYSGAFSQGTDINYFPASGLSPFLGNVTNASFDLTLHLAARMRIEQMYIYSRLGKQDEAVPNSSTRLASIYNDHMMRLKINYQFTKALSLRGILDYDGVLSNPSLISQPRTKDLIPNVLLTYQVNPGTALYAGYISDYENLSLRSPQTRTFEQIGPPSTATGRQFFVKMSYLLRF